MSDALQVFEFEEQVVRVLLEDGEPWFVGKDVCNYFGDTNYKRSLSRLDEDERGVHEVNTPGGKQKMTVVNECGLYHLLFNFEPNEARGVSEEYIKERQAIIQRFRRWVTHEVLPSIRKNGLYSIPDNELKKDEDKDSNEDLRLQLAEERLAIQRRNADARNAMALQRVVENPAYPLNKEQRQLLVYEIARLTTGKELELLEPIVSKTYYAASFVAEELGINLHSLIKIARQGGLISDEDKINKYGLWKLYKGKNKSQGDTLQFYFSEIGREKVKELYKEHKWGFK